MYLYEKYSIKRKRGYKNVYLFYTHEYTYILNVYK